MLCLEWKCQKKPDETHLFAMCANNSKRIDKSVILCNLLIIHLKPNQGAINQPLQQIIANLALVSITASTENRNRRRFPAQNVNQQRAGSATATSLGSRLQQRFTH